MDYFKQHLVDAIEINLERRPHYIQQAGLPALILSYMLVGSERLCIRMLSPKFDVPARAFIEKGVPVVKNDFVEMEGLPSVETPPSFSKVATRAQRKNVARMIAAAVKESRKALKQKDYESICKVYAGCLEELEEMEQAYEVHFAMTKHVVESAAIAALHAMEYIQMDENVASLCFDLTKTQIDVIQSSLMMDWLAQRCHAKGAGILVNDVPHIPFLTEWKNKLENTSH